MKSPPHPGRLIQQECLEPLGLSVADGVGVLGVPLDVLADVVNGRCGVSTDMAVRLSDAFGGTPRLWAGMQIDHDMAKIATPAEEP